MRVEDMCESNKHTGFKLFGRKIPVPEIEIPASSQERLDNVKNQKGVKPLDLPPNNTNKQVMASLLADGKEIGETTVQADRKHVNPQPKDEQEHTNNSNQENVVKKPDKIVPCPRCNSMDTKFCYFNNYNVNQPRHFCKNCQRYWTAGGKMRNVPVGAGRRKNKHLASQFRQILVSADSISATGLDRVNPQLLSSGESAMAYKPSVANSAFLKFNSGAPLCESMETVLNIGDPNACVTESVACRENAEGPSPCGTSGAPFATSRSESNENSHQRGHSGMEGSCNQHKQLHPLHFYAVPPMFVPWNTGWKNGVSMPSIQKSSDQVYVSNSSHSNQVQWCSGPMLAVPGVCPSNMPLQLVCPPYESCMPLMSNVAANISLMASSSCLSPSSSTSNSCCSGNESPTLGKHSRDTNLQDEGKAEKRVVLPKALRSDDRHNTPKSPLWPTSFIKPNQKDLCSKSSKLGACGSNEESKGHY